MSPLRLPFRPRTYKVVFTALVLCGLVVAVMLVRWWRGPEIPATTVVRGDVVRTVVASGRIATPYRVEVAAQVTGVVARVPVEEGQAVSAGQVLVELDAAEARATVRQAETAVEQAKARLRQVRELQLPVAQQGLRQAEVNADTAMRQFERQRELFAKGFIGQAALDDAGKARDLADAQLKTAQRQVETATPRGSDSALAQAALDQAHANLDLARARLGYVTIRAPHSGTLIARSVERGDVVQSGKTLMVLSPVGEIQAVVQIDERNLGLMRLGQKARLSADAYPARVLSAEVAYINPAVDPRTASVEVKLRVASPPAFLTQDMTVSVDIEVARHDGVLRVPADAVRDGGTSSPWVLKVSGGRAQRVAVKPGLAGAGVSEILEGLAEGDIVLLGRTVVPGQRVRPVSR